MPQLEKLSAISDALSHAGVAFHLLGDQTLGQAIVIAAGARVLALSAPGDDRNVMWLNPAISSLKNHSDVGNLGAGGIGGLRVWQAPEAAYMWDGAPDLNSFSNYRIQPAMDPGPYILSECSSRRCVLEARIDLRDYRTGAHVAFSVRRIIELAALPPALRAKNTRGVTLRLQHYFRLLKADDVSANVDLWHLLQLPAGTFVGARIKSGAQPVPYFHADRIGALDPVDGFLRWQTDGRRLSKFAIRVGDLSAGPYSLREVGDDLQCFFWQTPRVRTARYVDAPPNQTADDQLVQFWDGFDFCEVEYHTPGINAEQPEAVDASELVFLEQPGNASEGLDLLRKITTAL